MEIVSDACWQASGGHLGEAAQKQLLEANEDKTGEKMWQWLQETKRSRFLVLWMKEFMVRILPMAMGWLPKQLHVVRVIEDFEGPLVILSGVYTLLQLLIYLRK